MENVPEGAINPHAYQAYTFAPVSQFGPASVRIIFKEKGLNQAQLQVYQASTGIWHTYNINVTVSEDQVIDKPWMSVLPFLHLKTWRMPRCVSWQVKAQMTKLKLTASDYAYPTHTTRQSQPRKPNSPTSSWIESFTLTVTKTT